MLCVNCQCIRSAFGACNQTAGPGKVRCLTQQQRWHGRGRRGGRSTVVDMPGNVMVSVGKLLRRGRSTVVAMPGNVMVSVGKLVREEHSG